MGYTTDFEGQFDLDKPLTAAQVAYINKFSETRRMKRDEKKAAKLPDPVREVVGLSLGKDAEYFVGGAGFAGQEHDGSILDYNSSSSSQPGLWCQWVATDDGMHIEWNRAEKFYAYIEWLQYIIDHFLKPWGINASGEVRWQGEESNDKGKIVVKGNKITIKKGRVVYE